MGRIVLKRQKQFNAELILNAVNTGTQAVGMIQSSKQSAEVAKQAEDASLRSREQTKALNNLVKAAESNSKIANDLSTAGGAIIAQRAMSFTHRWAGSRKSQKLFFLPALIGVGGLALSAGGMIQSSIQSSAAAEQAEQASVDMNKQTEALSRLAAVNERAQNRLAQKGMSNVGTTPTPTTQNKGSILSNSLGFAKDIGKGTGRWIKNNPKMLTATVSAGVITAGVKYGVNKWIQKDMEKNGMSMDYVKDNQNRQLMLQSGMTPDQVAQYELQKRREERGGRRQKSYSIGEWVGVPSLMGAGFEAFGQAAQNAPTVSGYLSQRKQFIKQRKRDEKIEKYKEILRKQGKSIPAAARNYHPEQPQTQGQGSVVGNQQRAYSSTQVKPTPTPTPKSKSVSSLKNKAASTAYGVADFGAMMMGGGSHYVKSIGRGMQKLGKESGNVYTQKTGDWIMKNQKKALVGTLGVGAVMAKGFGHLFNAGYKTGDKAFRSLDKKAYEYNDVMESPNLVD